MSTPETLKSEKPQPTTEQNLSAVLEMTRAQDKDQPDQPQSVELTPQQDQQLLEILNQAKAQEEQIKQEPDQAKRLLLYQKTIDLYHQYKQQFLKIKQEQTPQLESNLENFEQIKQAWINFYNQLNLPQFSQDLEDFSPNLTPQQQEQYHQQQEQGLNYPILLPRIETQQQYFQTLAQETTKPLEGLSEEDKEQYDKEEGLWLSSLVKPHFPDKIKTTNRPNNQPYLLLVPETPEVEEKTLNQTPQKLKETLAKNQQTGLTLPEYLIFQRAYTEKHQTHPDQKYLTYLLDSEITDDEGPARVLRADWDSDYRRVRVLSDAFGSHHSVGGARSSAIFF